MQVRSQRRRHSGARFMQRSVKIVNTTRLLGYLIVNGASRLVFAHVRLHLAVVDGTDLGDLAALVLEDHRIQIVAHGARGARYADTLGELQIDTGWTYRNEVRLVEG